MRGATTGRSTRGDQRRDEVREGGRRGGWERGVDARVERRRVIAEAHEERGGRGAHEWLGVGVEERVRDRDGAGGGGTELEEREERVLPRRDGHGFTCERAEVERLEIRDVDREGRERAIEATEPVHDLRRVIGDEIDQAIAQRSVESFGGGDVFREELCDAL
jgi:hypothetical protein